VDGREIGRGPVNLEGTVLIQKRITDRPARQTPREARVLTVTVARYGLSTDWSFSFPKDEKRSGGTCCFEHAMSRNL
jgi:hypothetical protein